MIVKPGERIPVDGKIISGCGMVNQSTLTGESIPVERGVGDKVYCGTVMNPAPASSRRLRWPKIRNWPRSNG